MIRAAVLCCLVLGAAQGQAFETGCRAFFAASPPHAETFCTADALFYCNAIAAGVVEEQARCSANGKAANLLIPGQWQITVTDTSEVEYRKLDLEIIGPAERLISRRARGSDRINARIFGFFGYGGRNYDAVMIHTVRHNIYGFDRATEAQNPNNRLIEDYDPVENFATRLESMIQAAYARRWEQVNAD